MNKFQTQTYDSTGRPYLTIPIPMPSPPTNAKTEELVPERGVIVIDMCSDDDEVDNKIVFEF